MVRLSYGMGLHNICNSFHCLCIWYFMPWEKKIATVYKVLLTCQAPCSPSQWLCVMCYRLSSCSNTEGEERAGNAGGAQPRCPFLERAPSSSSHEWWPPNAWRPPAWKTAPSYAVSSDFGQWLTDFLEETYLKLSWVHILTNLFPPRVLWQCITWVKILLPSLLLDQAVLLFPPYLRKLMPSDVT